MNILIGLNGNLNSGKLDIVNIIKNRNPGLDIGVFKLSNIYFNYEINNDLSLKKHIQQNLCSLKLKHKVILCDDIKKLEEVEILKREGFTLVKISRPQISFKNRISNHKFDFCIENNGTFEDFEYVVNEMFLDIQENNTEGK